MARLAQLASTPTAKATVMLVVMLVVFTRDVVIERISPLSQVAFLFAIPATLLKLGSLGALVSSLVQVIAGACVGLSAGLFVAYTYEEARELWLLAVLYWVAIFVFAVGRASTPKYLTAFWFNCVPGFSSAVLGALLAPAGLEVDFAERRAEGMLRVYGICGVVAVAVYVVYLPQLATPSARLHLQTAIRHLQELAVSFSDAPSSKARAAARSELNAAEQALFFARIECFAFGNYDRLASAHRAAHHALFTMGSVGGIHFAHSLASCPKARDAGLGRALGEVSALLDAAVDALDRPRISRKRAPHNLGAVELAPLKTQMTDAERGSQAMTTAFEFITEVARDVDHLVEAASTGCSPPRQCPHEPATRQSWSQAVHNIKPAVQFGVKCATTVFLMFLYGLLEPSDFQEYGAAVAPTLAFFVFEETVGAIAAIAKVRILGSVLAMVAALISGPLFVDTGLDGLFVVWGAMVAAPGLYIQDNWPPPSRTYGIAIPIAYLIVAERYFLFRNYPDDNTTSDQTIEEIVGYRMAATLVPIIAATLVNATVWPVQARDRTLQLCIAVVRECGDALQTYVAGLPPRKVLPTVLIPLMQAARQSAKVAALELTLADEARKGSLRDIVEAVGMVARLTSRLVPHKVDDPDLDAVLVRLDLCIASMATRRPLLSRRNVSDGLIPPEDPENTRMQMQRVLSSDLDNSVRHLLALLRHLYGGEEAPAPLDAAKFA